MRPASGGGSERAIFESPTSWKVPRSWVGGWLAFETVENQTGFDVWLLAPDRPSEPPVHLLKTVASESDPQISPDGRWLAYASNETKADQYEIYVRPFPAGAGRWQVSRTGGDWPRWSRDGKELYFLSNVPENQTSISATMSTVKVGAKGDTFVYEPPVEILQLRAINLDHPGRDFHPHHHSHPYPHPLSAPISHLPFLDRIDTLSSL